ncbi:hypothetical protein OH799_32730 [Nocardia sp. NBC_00881]|uniref:hypothetical protein n=1 Tax=Nocardia sp. NBC_00881 TaxID=2975995 RepID=UPI00386347D7|nr:hypothetical protein OH799_32730 [Nocardia sp. NBC_00881]
MPKAELPQQTSIELRPVVGFDPLTLELLERIADALHELVDQSSAATSSRCRGEASPGIGRTSYTTTCPGV